MENYKIISGTVRRWDGTRVPGFYVKERFLKFFWKYVRTNIYGHLWVPGYPVFFESYKDADVYVNRKAQQQDAGV